ncbi:MAG TPA: hypothetical protein VN848_10030 [Gemmatimonadales bacterium]|nr:hypothetical protein [Gemmatimonadales bacterium]
MPDDVIRLRTNDPRVVAMADRLWDRAPRGTGTGALPAPVEFTIEVTSGHADVPLCDAGDERWTVGPDDVELSLGDVLKGRIECATGRVTARVAGGLLAAQPALVARLVLEAPAGATLARRGYGVVHAGAVVGPGGAVVLRGAPGAGKSTLVAAAHLAGFGVLADEAILVARRDPDQLLAAVRDVTLLPDSQRLLGLDGSVVRSGAGERTKGRLDLFASSTPDVRRARRVASILLGPRTGPARLDPLTPDAFLAEFARGAIAQERWSGTPAHIAAHWSQEGAFRLSGASDLPGALALLRSLPGASAVRRRA